MGQRPSWFLSGLSRLPKRQLCITATISLLNYPTYKTKNRWCSIDAHFNVLSIQYLLPPIFVYIMIWTCQLPFWLIETRPCGKAEPSNILAPFAFIPINFIYLAEWFISPTVHLFINQYSHVTAHDLPLIFHSMKFSVRQHKAPGDTYSCILSYFSLVSLFLLISIELTVTNLFWEIFFDWSVGGIHPGTFVVAHASRNSGL